MLKRTLVVSAIACSLIATPIFAGLTVGDKAPKLEVKEWIKGKPVDLSQREGKVTVVEFWATWCGPCISSMPHLTELQKQYADKGVTIIGLTYEDPNNSLEEVKEFVGENAEKTGYTIAWDDGEKTNDAYMAAANQNGIPTAFIVDKSGMIAWIGHPMGMDETLAAIVNDKFDIEIEAKIFPVVEMMNEARWSSGELDVAMKASELVMALKPNHRGAWITKLSILAEDEKRAEETMTFAKEAIEVFNDQASGLNGIAGVLLQGDNKAKRLALSAAERAGELDPDNMNVRITMFNALAATQQYDRAVDWARQTIKLASNDAGTLSRFAYILSNGDHADRCSEVALQAVNLAIVAEPDEPRHLQSKFRILAVCKKDVKGALAVGQYFVEKASENAGALNNFSWDLLTNEDLKGKFTELALTAAQRCDKASDGENWMFIDTLALATFEAGDVAEAIKLQNKAIELCPSDMMLPELEKTLERFKKSE